MPVIVVIAIVPSAEQHEDEDDHESYGDEQQPWRGRRCVQVSLAALQVSLGLDDFLHLLRTRGALAPGMFSEKVHQEYQPD
jgi:hypothetical protein